ncbi:hypothetical protein PPSIR1_31538 [Plesiocystis pacifica SIR-1]|uniref:TonB C-terminal domain-containing protein n=1 Tax=Plesiocystis pacifica SIR-1 TaxID=391625 RepID=A6GF48_9BACT|nr:hypothetical protein PPSIR1_31538 [Plesiocystis pacifica SIR-1]
MVGVATSPRLEPWAPCALLIASLACAQRPPELGAPPDAAELEPGLETQIETEAGAPPLVFPGHRYPEDGFVLTADATIQGYVSGPSRAGHERATARSLLEARPARDGRLRLRWRTLELFEFAASGSLAPEPSEPSAALFSTKLATSFAEAIVTGHGELDTAAMRRRGTYGSTPDVAIGLFELPLLPAVDLTPGVVHESAAELREMPMATQLLVEDLPVARAGEVVQVPVECTTRWVLRAFTQRGDARLAELDYATTCAGTGAPARVGPYSTTEVEAPRAFHYASQFTLLFDLAARLPVELSGYRELEYGVDAGDRHPRRESYLEYSVRYTPGLRPARPAVEPRFDLAAGPPDVPVQAVYTPDPDPRRLADTAAALGMLEPRSVVEFCVATNGKTTRLRVVESHDPDVDLALVATIAKWRFKPALRDGEPVEACLRETFEFDPAAVRYR